MLLLVRLSGRTTWTPCLPCWSLFTGEWRAGWSIRMGRFCRRPPLRWLWRPKLNWRCIFWTPTERDPLPDYFCFNQQIDCINSYAKIIQVAGIEKDMVTTSRGEYWRLLMPGTYHIRYLFTPYWYLPYICYWCGWQKTIYQMRWHPRPELEIHLTQADPS